VCSFTPNVAIICAVDVTFNDYKLSDYKLSDNDNNGVECGDVSTAQAAGKVTSDSGVELMLDLNSDKDLATITMSGPGDGWVGVGFSARAMGDEPYAIILHKEDGDEEFKLTERKLGNHEAGTELDSSLKLKSLKVSFIPSQLAARLVTKKYIAIRLTHSCSRASLKMCLASFRSAQYDEPSNTRTAVFTRSMTGLTDDHYTFHLTGETSIPLISAIGSSPAFGIHKLHDTTTTISLETSRLGVNNCVCSLGTYGSICGHADENGNPDPTNCNAFPTGGVGGGERAKRSEAKRANLDENEPSKRSEQQTKRAANRASSKRSEQQTERAANEASSKRSEQQTKRAANEASSKRSEQQTKRAANESD